MGMEKYADKRYAFTATLLLVLRELIKEKDESTLCQIFEKIEEHITMFEQKKLPTSVVCRTVYKELDMFIEKEKPPNISCRAGCAHCCGQYVAVSRAEARHLVKVAKANGIPIDRDRLQKQAVMNVENWHTLPIPDQACVFLDPTTQRCRVYHDRPLACRKYFVVGPPELCNINTNRDIEQPVWFQLDAELVSTAWMTVDECESLSNLLLQEEMK